MQGIFFLFRPISKKEKKYLHSGRMYSILNECRPVRHMQYGQLVKRLRRRPLTAKTGVRFPYWLFSHVRKTMFEMDFGLFYFPCLTMPVCLFASCHAAPQPARKSNRLIWLDSGKSPRIPSESSRSVILLLALDRSRKSSLLKNGPPLAASAMASAAFSPSPSMLFKEGISSRP